MGRPAQLQFTSLKNCLINLPLSIHGPLLERGIAPQSLVVELSYPSSTSKKVSNKIYVGWTGMPSEISGVGNQVRGGGASMNRVEMDPQFAFMLGNGLMEGMPVSIELLRDLPVATSVSVTPVSADDWEILETNAEFIETNLLNQVRAVKEGMVVGCWVGGTTLVRFTVDATVPAASPALLLTSATELIVAPKTRHNYAPTTTKSHDLSSPQASTSAIPKSPIWDAHRRKLIRLLPIDFDLPFLKPPKEPTQLLLENGTSSASTSNSTLNGIKPTGILPTELELLTTIYISPEQYYLLQPALPSLRCTIFHYQRPTPALIKAIADAKDREIATNTVDKEEEDRKLEIESRTIEVRIKEGKGIPYEHCWIGAALRRELKIDESRTGFELIKLGNPLTSAAKKAKSNATKGATSPTTNGSSRTPIPRRTSGMNGSIPATNSEQQTAPPTTVALPTSIPEPPTAGVEDKLEKLRSHVIHSLNSRKLFDTNEAASGMLVTGASGAGKSMIVKQVAKELSLDPRSLTHVIQIDCSKLLEERIPNLKIRMKDWFDEACWHAPSLLVLDNLDRLLAAEVEHADSFPATHRAHAFVGVATPALVARPIVIIATAQSSASLHPLLTATHLIGDALGLRGPSKVARKDILASLVKAKADRSNIVANSLDYAALAALTEGYLPADLRDLVNRSIQQAAIRANKTNAPKDVLNLNFEDFTSAQVGFSPLSLRDIKLQKSEVQWADIGGLHETRKILRETLEWPTKYAAIFANCPLRLRSGLLLYGFPGCGKTLLASAVAKECGLNFISVKGPEILNKYIGASEKSVRDLFERAQAAKPCILFFDEFDSIAPKRGHDSTGVTDRVVNQMLTQMDGAEGLEGVYVLAATSRPDLIDPALLRPGRLDKSLLCDMPNFQDRLEIMKACSRKIDLAPDVDLSAYAEKTLGFSGADLQALVYNAHLDAVHASLTASSEVAKGSREDTVEKELEFVTFGGPEGDNKVISRAEKALVTKRLEVIMSTLSKNDKNAKKAVVSTVSRPITLVQNYHLQASLKSTRPSVPVEELARLRKIYSEFVSGRSPNGLPSGEASDEIGGRASLM